MKDGKHIHVDREDGELQTPFQGPKTNLMKKLIYDIRALQKYSGYNKLGNDLAYTNTHTR